MIFQSANALPHWIAADLTGLTLRQSRVTYPKLGAPDRDRETDLRETNPI